VGLENTYADGVRTLRVREANKRVESGKKTLTSIEGREKR